MGDCCSCREKRCKAVAIGFLALADWSVSVEDLEARSSECLSFARPREKALACQKQTL